MRRRIRRFVQQGPTTVLVPPTSIARKGLSKRHNDIDKDTFLAVLKNRRSGGGFNRGFRVRDSSVMTYIQERAALTYFYEEAQSTRRRSQHGASGSVKGSDNQTTVHSPTWIHAGKHPFTWHRRWTDWMW